MRVPKRAASVAGALLAFVTVSRALVLFLEALAAVRDERTRDSELLSLCQSGAARESPKMRSACLQAQADRASPLLLKAVLRAINTAFDDFTSSVSSPGRLALVLVFAMVSVFMPLTNVIKALVPREEIEGSQRVVVVAGDSQLVSPRQRLRRAVGGLRLRRRQTPHLEEVDEEDGGQLVAVNMG